jgi:nitrogen-specific signal transduction histidine kinase
MKNEWKEKRFGPTRGARELAHISMNDEKWKELCQMIMTETDPEKLWRLVEQLNTEFERREEELRRGQPTDPSSQIKAGQ